MSETITYQETHTPIGKNEHIGEYQELTSSYVTVPKVKIEPEITILDPANLVLEANYFLKRQLESIGFETNGFHKIVEVDREPKFVVDILIRIPRLNRNKKFAVLSSIGDLMRNYPKLLFDFRIVRHEDIPEGYTVI